MTPLQTLHDLLDHTSIWQRSITLPRGAPLTLPGITDRNLYRVDLGTLVSTLEVAGTEQCCRFGYAGDYVMSLDSYITNQPTAYGIYALRRCEVAVASFGALQDFLAQCAGRSQIWEEAKGGLILSFLEREIDLLTPSPEERYRRVLDRSPRLFQEVPAKYIANYLRMTPETLSRLKKEA
ncbi:hypothetical protein LEM8419_00219 [Neolewinella maritima]|uniref:Crp/Fnr family transcriptional regulator n=1 Tax=Neolewinella maritima TaxID=1383882 RepID=A0ABM9AW49_9BACT|nr:Crp/Fnr family transcriptional regulator [Neolewinella maritima]CAH0998923.1 hypothetical protein LEM8419_00219 [Neolewinella maritima]